MAATFDGTTARIRFRASIFGCTGFDLAEEKIKVEKVAEIGSMYPEHRTIGMVEVGDALAKIRVPVWAQWLTKLPDDFTEVEFPVTIADRHPKVAYPYSAIMDQCRIIGTKRSIEASEKAGIVEIPLSVMFVLHNGGDGWKHIGRRSGQPSAAALALQF